MGVWSPVLLWLGVGLELGLCVAVAPGWCAGCVQAARLEFFLAKTTHELGVTAGMGS